MRASFSASWASTNLSLSAKRAFAFAAATCVLAPIAYMSMFTGFRAYDDEGYYLANLSDYLAGHPLLTPDAQVYGPFFYEFFGGLFKLLGLAPDNDTGRLVTAVIWVVASVAGSLVAFRLSRNIWLGLAAALLTFGVLTVLTNEPMSTYGLSALLFLGLTAAAILSSARPRASAALIGVIVGALCLIKINVGAFAAVAVVFAWTGTLTQRWRRVLLPLMAVVITAVPFLLTLSLLTVDWVFEFAVVVALSAAAIGVACVTAITRPGPAPSLLWIAAVGAVFVIASLGVALAGGTHPGDVWNGLVATPLRFPRIWTFPVTLNAGFDLAAGVSFTAALVASLRHKMAAVGGLVRVGAGFFTWLTMLLLPSSTFLLALPLAWLATQAPDEEGADPVGAYPRMVLPTLAVLESLQAYPIAGSQLSMAAFCLVPIGAITLGDGIRQLRGATLQAAGWVAPAAVATNVAVFLLLALTVTAGFRSDIPLGVRGAESIRLPAETATQVRLLVAAVDRECSSFVTFPGMNSLYIWTGQDPPTSVHIEVWWLILDADQQQAVVQQLAGKPRLCVIKNQEVINMWTAGGQVPHTPLVDFIDGRFAHDSSYGDYELLVSAGS